MIYALLIFAAIVILLIIFNYVNNQKKQGETSAAIREKWGKPIAAERYFNRISIYSNADGNAQKLPPSTIADLDLEQVFSFIDRTNSKPGQQYLYNKLFGKTPALEQLTDVDKQVADLPADKVILETYQVKLAELDSNNAYYLPELFKQQASLFGPLVTFYIRVSGITIITLFTLMIIAHSQLYFFVVMAMVIANFAIHYSTKKKVLQYTHSLPQLVKLISTARWFRKQPDGLSDSTIEAAIADTTKLKRSLSYVSFNAALNDPTDLAYAFFELFKTLLLIDPLMFITSINRVNQYKESIRVVFDYVAHIDFLISIRSVREGLPYYCKPVFTTDDTLAVTELYHPLVDGCVANSITTKADRGVLVTGSNMSGKTTFIRSIAINALLAQTIFTSCSESYTAPWLNLHTSIRISDDMEEHKSYFQAEALSILEILNQCEADRPVKSLVLIDEIFRGTNTIERIAAAKAVLAHLTANGTFVFVSTHDLELAELLGSDYSTYSFEEIVTDGARLLFDYRMKPGLLKNKNGIAILKAMGYPQSVVDDASTVSEQLRQKYEL